MRVQRIEPDTANFLEARRQMEKRYPMNRRYFLADLVRATEQIDGHKHEEFISSSRSSKYALSRWRLFHIARFELALSYAQIGRLMLRDHSTVIHGLKKYEEEFLHTPTEQAKRNIIIARAESLFLNIPVELDDAEP